MAYQNLSTKLYTLQVQLNSKILTDSVVMISTNVRLILCNRKIRIVNRENEMFAYLVVPFKLLVQYACLAHSVAFMHIL